MARHYTLYKAKRIITMDAMHPEAEAIVICNSTNTISEVGDYDDLIDGLLQKNATYTVNTDYEDHYIFPGFIESHCHATVAGAFFNLPYVGQFPRSDTDNKHLSFSTNAAVLDYLNSLPHEDNALIIGWGYDPVLMHEPTCLTRFDLDTVSQEKPVVIFNASCHAAVFNTQAMKQSGLMNDLDNNDVIKDEAGVPNGQVVELTAFKHAFQFLDLTADKLRAGLYQVANTALRNGFTSISDMAIGFIEGDLAALITTVNEPEFPVRVTGYVMDSYVKSSLDDTIELQALAARNNEKLRIAGGKFFTDGSIQVHTACMHYHDSEETGVLNTDLDELKARYNRYLDAGLQCATHCNGTDGIQMSIDAVKAVARERGSSTAGTFRMEHCQTVSEDQLYELKQYGITPTFLINHLCFWSDFHASHSLGLGGVKHLDPCHSALRHCIRFSLHSDCPVSTLDPFLLIYGATERTSRISGTTYGPQERISVYEAVRALTIDAAYIQNEEHLKGSLVKGKFADFIVLDRNLLEYSGEELVNTQVLAAHCDGQVHGFDDRC